METQLSLPGVQHIIVFSFFNWSVGHGDRYNWVKTCWHMVPVSCSSSITSCHLQYLLKTEKPTPFTHCCHYSPAKDSWPCWLTKEKICSSSVWHLSKHDVFSEVTLVFKLGSDQHCGERRDWRGSWPRAPFSCQNPASDVFTTDPPHTHLHEKTTALLTPLDSQTKVTFSLVLH